MLVSAKEMLQKAKAGHYAVGQFNINNLEWTKSILLTAQEMDSPVILGVSEGAGKYMCGFKTVSAMVKAMIEELNITVPVALHLDHGTYEGCYKCIEAGFSSIMFDGSSYPIDENVAKTKAAKKTVLLVWANAQTLMSARRLQILAWTCWPQVSAISMASIRLTGLDSALRHWQLYRRRQVRCLLFFTAVQVFLMI